MSYSLAEAAQATGLNRSTILRAIKQGAISGVRDAGAWSVEPVELHRVFPPAAATPKAAPQDAQADALVAELRASALPNGLPWARPSRQNPTQSRCPRPCLMHHRRRAGAAPGAGCARPADRHGEDAGATKGQSPIASRSPYAAGPRCSHIFGAHWADVGLHVRNLAV